jgi:hypothetical protein
MAEETTQTNGTPPQTNGTSNGAATNQTTERLIPSFRLEQEISAKREAVKAQEAAHKQIEELKAQLQEAQTQLSSRETNYQQDMHLINQGFKAESVRRFFRREYASAVSELGTDQRPPFDAWLEANRDDPLYSVHFDRLAAPATPAAQESGSAARPERPSAPQNNDNLLNAIAAAMQGNPNAGAGQPADNRQKEWTVEEMRKLRARNGGSLGKHRDEIMAQWRAKGLIT